MLCEIKKKHPGILISPSESSALETVNPGLELNHKIFKQNIPVPNWLDKTILCTKIDQIMVHLWILKSFMLKIKLPCGISLMF